MGFDTLNQRVSNRSASAGSLARRTITVSRMRTTAEFAALVRNSAALWWRGLPSLVLWFSLGYGINELTGHASTLLVGQRILATTIIVLGIVAWVGCLVLAVHSLRPEHAPENSRLAVLAASLGPFLAVYGAWGLAQEQFERLIQANLMTHGVDADQFSINAGDWQFFLGFAALAWVVRTLVRLAARRFNARALLFAGLVADGAWVFASFFVLREWVARGFGWLTTRAVWRWLQTGWDGFIDVLPDVPVWFQLTLPEALQALAANLWSFVAPGFANAVLLPLMWVALVGTVFGRRTFSAAELVGGLRPGRAASGSEHRRSRPLRTLTRLATGEMREKYVPMAATVRLLRHCGARFIGAFLVLVAAVQLAGYWLDQALLWLIGPRPLADTLLYMPTENYLVAMLTTTLLLACYTAAFGRALEAQPRPTGNQGRSSMARGGVENRR